MLNDGSYLRSMPVAVLLADRILSRLWHSVSFVCLSSVTFCIVAKRNVLAKNCLKEEIGLPPETTHGT